MTRMKLSEGEEAYKDFFAGKSKKKKKEVK